MAGFSGSIVKTVKSWVPIADACSWYCAVVLLGVILLGGSIGENYNYDEETVTQVGTVSVIRGNHLRRRPCDEIYVVGEGETLHTISDKCGDPFIVERNPHIHDPDDVFPGLVIKIISPNPTSK
ncbi:hypothetical protein ABFS82_06G039000 [Erythranthe guttata]|uniref:LysM domain-containing protein n=1 Tax=Erythranthe guttata TaxID=4155 RepID=A0A022QBQ5_ERYGU|nr:PREDICTED: uncharacterized protein LOC105971675 [Erythranthe guttata]EYU25044.1 hypothetical protein MIMGU_mgv1a024197mg [Erythranthe guttata]|eukprot:XP_012851994.1 PREDICTED: uncharacterized protein LOC105971675 [Erythranthe guttata]